jgi:hypothetical protein
MQVDRQPSPWPCVAMLAGLLLLCLMAPRYWQNAVVSEDPAIGGETEVAAADSDHGQYRPTHDNSSHPTLAGGLFDLSGINIGGFANGPNNDLLNLCAPPPFEELIATQAAMSQLSTHFGRAGGDGFDWPLLVRAAMGAGTNEFSTGPELTGGNRPNSAFAPPFEFVGGLVSEYSSVDAMYELAAEVADGVPYWVVGCGEQVDSLFAGLQTTNSGPALVQVTSPDDRLAMLPTPRELDAAHPWCVPQALLDQLDRLAGQPESAQWASQVRNQLHVLTDREQLEGDDVQIILADLSDAAQEAIRMADQYDNDQLRVELLRVHWALARRLDCWGAMHEKRVASHFQSRVAARGSLNPYLGGTAEASTVPTEVTALSNDIEKYETNRDPKLGRSIALQQQSLKASSDAIDRNVAESVEEHYRNANVRVAITAEMLNRLAGVERNESKPVSSQIAGSYVHGQSNVHSESRVLLDPSADEWQLELKADGVVDSNTLANSGPVRFRSRGTTDFTARKTIMVNDKGVHFKQSNVDADCNNRLVGVTTDYDWVPLFGNYARDRAIGEYHARQGRAKSQIESRVSTEAGESLDKQTQEAVDQIRKQTYDRFASEFDKFDIKMTPVEMKTTTDRLVARVRVAGDKQLGSHTPRPRALSDSLASAQIHETALTNLAVTLGLDGKRYTAPELRNMLREKFPQLATKNATEARQETVFQFAPEDAVQIHINNGKLELTISFTSIELQHDVMRDVVVHAYYTPKIEGLTAELVRDGTLGIEGRFDSGDRARLHNVFNRVLPPERHLPIVAIDKPTDKRFQGLMITQLVLEDGWVGLAVGPTTEARVAESSRSLR